MESRLKRNLVIGSTVLATAAFAGGAYAATQDSGATSRQAFLNDVSQRLHVTPQQLTGAIRGAFLDQLQAAVKAGRLTQSEANAIKQRVQQGELPPIGLGPRGIGGPRFFGPPGVHDQVRASGGPLGAAASYLGLAPAQLFDELSSGKSLAQIASSRGKSVSGLEHAMITASRSKLDKAVANHVITEAQEQQILGRLSTGISQLVNHTPRFAKGPFPRFMPGPPRPGGWGGGVARVPAPANGAGDQVPSPAPGP